MKILLLEDDNILAESMKLLLESEGFEVDLVSLDKEVYEKTFNNKYDLYVFDINLNNSENGLEILKNLRDADDNTPTIFITALTDIKTIQEAFNIGAEDFIKKPFEIEEVLIRIKSKFQKRVKIKDLEYDPVNEIIYKNNKPIYLSPVLKSIFKELIKNSPNPTPKEVMLDLLENQSDNALRVNISKLKAKLGINIKNIRNQGYLIE